MIYMTSEIFYEACHIVQEYVVFQLLQFFFFLLKGNTHSYEISYVSTYFKDVLFIHFILG